MKQPNLCMPTRQLCACFNDLDKNLRRSQQRQLRVASYKRWGRLRQTGGGWLAG